MKLPRFGLTPREHRISALPSTVGSVLVLAITVFNGTVLWPQGYPKTLMLVSVGILGILYLFVLTARIIPHPRYSASFGWPHAVLTAAGLAVISYSVVDGLNAYVGVLLVLAVITSAIISDRAPSYALITLATLAIFLLNLNLIASLQHWTLQVSMVIVAIIALETVQQLKRRSRGHIRRLQSIAEFSRHISSSLNNRQVMALLTAAFQNAVEADTYFVGIRDGDHLRLELCYDDGEFFEGQRVSLEGSLSSWVLESQQSLFLPDLRNEVDLPGVRLVLVGKHKTSLSWLGVPMRAYGFDGIISIGSYRPNAFDQGDLELLTALAQHAAQALDNTYHHEQVELRSQLDSLTGLFNHGHFLAQLQEQIASVALEGRPLALIMLDVDHFKLYNDTYGHTVGDDVLTQLSTVMQKRVKRTDAVGRWGGEEFAISLPGADAAQASQIALRIRTAMRSISLQDAQGNTVPSPTVSQGIAVYPQEAQGLDSLVHLADRRLYVAKARGRNQIEPEPTTSLAGADQQLQTAPD